MALFRWPGDSGRLDFELLRETPVSLYFARDVLAEHIAWLREHRYLAHTFDCSGWASEEDFHTEVSRALGFPDHYGRNLAAFNDCLCDVQVPEEGGTALAFVSVDALFRRSPEYSWHILDIIALRSRRLLLEGRRLLALVHSDDRGIRINPVGATPVLWNWTERGRHMRQKWEEARKNPGQVGPPEEGPEGAGLPPG